MCWRTDRLSCQPFGWQLLTRLSKYNFIHFKPKIMAGRVTGVRECTKCGVTQSESLSKRIQNNPKKSGFHKVEGILTKHVKCHNRNPKTCKNANSYD